MMKVRVYQDKVTISGYVNAVERMSKKLHERGEEFYEKVKEGAFGDAIRRNNNIKLLLNHKYDRELGSTTDNLELFEDSIGLFARATVTDNEVVEKAKNNQLSGWSFGFIPLKTDDTFEYQGVKLRNVESLNLYEVSILDKDHIPAYNSMSINVRNMGNEPLEIRSFTDLKIEKEKKKELETIESFDNSIFIAKIENFINERK